MYLSCVPFGLLGASLSPELNSKYHYDSFKIGWMFGLCAVTYLICCLVSGFLSDSNQFVRRTTIIVGLVIAAFGMFLLGPSTLFESFVPADFAGVIGSLVTIGAGAAVMFSPLMQ